MGRPSWEGEGEGEGKGEGKGEGGLDQGINLASQHSSRAEQSGAERNKISKARTEIRNFYEYESI